MSSSSRFRLVTAALFLLASVIAAGLMVRGALVSAREAASVPSATPRATATPLPPTLTATSLPTATPTPSPTPTPTPDGVQVVVAQDAAADPAAQDSFVGALSAGLAAAPLPEPVDLSVAAEGASDAAADLTITWQVGEDGEEGVLLDSPFQPPPPPRVDAQPGPWQVTAPGGYPIWIGDDATFAAGAAVALLDAAYGAPDDARQIVNRLRPTLYGQPRALAANHAAHLAFVEGRIAEAEGRPLAALRAYSEALRRGGDAFGAATIARGNVYYALGDAAAALAAYDAAQAGTRSDLAAAYNRALAYQRAGDSAAAAVEAGRVGELAGESALSANLLGWLAYQEGDYAAARGFFAQAAELASYDPVPLYNLARSLHELGAYEDAADAFDRLVTRYPRADFLYYQGQNFEALGETDAALDAYGIAIRYNDDHTEAHLARGRLWLAAGDLDGAREDADRAITLAPDRADGYSVRGLALLAGEDYAGAEDALSEAIALGDARAEIYAARAWARHVRGYRLGAVSDYREAVARGVEDGETLKRAGFLHFALGHYDEALGVFTTAAARLPDDPDAQAGLALALDTDFQREAAAEQYQRVLDLDERYGRAAFLGEQPLWSELAVNRAVAILRRLGVDPYE